MSKLAEAKEQPATAKQAGPTSEGKRRSKLDLSTLGGLGLALLGILGGYALEHGRAGDLWGASAALIVLGGSIGATLVANPVGLVKRAARRASSLIFEYSDDSQETLDRMVNYAMRARKNGVVSLEQEAAEIQDPFLRKSMMLAVDGMDLHEIRASMELEMDAAERRLEEEAKVFEIAGGFAPTIGIIGAVLGLIIVMGELSDMNKVGKGIAAAFVATIYGVGSANLVFLPAALKIKLRGAAEREKREMMLEGVCGIVEGMNPKMLRGKLEAFTAGAPEKPEEPAVDPQRTAA
ncbi:flagellar motor protein [Paludibaculum fermentans]|uniref:Flagellar motor protein n=1 Tax=Paludibaculum fermentans TaxID=1473598 RepID=A0A7S7NKM6_PALFE|nr:flagellar motor protein [Paludibaculum fermentans]QOY85398.1 flagellar motor protein [Paludibaculum fermentans]